MVKTLDISVVIPAYNESRRIGRAVSDIVAFMRAEGRSFELIVVNDGSTDDTAEHVVQFSTEYPEVKLLSYPCNMGKGYAVKHGVMASQGSLVLFSDADMSVPIEDFRLLEIKLAAGFSVAIGSRSIEGSDLKIRQPKYRELGGKCINFAVRLLAVEGIMDTQCGFKLFNGDMARKVFDVSKINGYAFDVEILYLVTRMGGKIAEVPVHWSHREGSKVNPFKDGIKLLMDLIRIRYFSDS